VEKACDHSCSSIIFFGDMDKEKQCVNEDIDHILH
jgi:hypothetical protein